MRYGVIEDGIGRKIFLPMFWYTDCADPVWTRRMFMQRTEDRYQIVPRTTPPGRSIR